MGFNGNSPVYYRNGKISGQITEAKDNLEGVLYRIGFEFYDEKLCEFDGMKSSELKKVIEFLSRIGKCSNYEDIQSRVPQEMKRVNNSNDYSRFFKHLTDDVDLQEFDAGNRRGFFFFDHSAKLLQLVAIAKHPEYKKQRRR